MNIYLLNGPPRSGKDTAGKMLAQMLPGKTVILKFSEPLKLATHAVISLLRGEAKIMPADHYEKTKDERDVDFLGTTPRRAYISLSEDFCKKQFGDAIFGEVMVRKIRKLQEEGVDNVVITDCGFVREVAALGVLQDAVIMLLKIHRPGTSFSGDSRDYLDYTKLPVAAENTLDLTNNGSIGALRVAVATAITTLKGD
ncbi:MAG: hypothetical protein H6590_06185 [Flavobacteriales bacterium]|nr:hypothetical protein [Flavobacteriales bacterium]